MITSLLSFVYINLRLMRKFFNPVVFNNMGHHVSALISGLGRFFEYPVKRKPICFYRQEDFTATGEPQKKVTDHVKPPTTDYDKLVELFYKRLAEQRQYNQLVYNFSPQEDEQLTGLAQLCNDVADNIQFVSNLTVGEQLEYGLF
ncbi:unnamed protein product [Leptidea sinapis]|uniref:Uncharacterized protein n=1 Tax=Leptidea sinapis TaxID=189913 RepID=A0A5E4Q6R7_9NEOP|nr:unnamed protein product [Leptidea sinapis]